MTVIIDYVLRAWLYMHAMIDYCLPVHTEPCFILLYTGGAALHATTEVTADVLYNTGEHVLTNMYDRACIA